MRPCRICRHVHRLLLPLDPARKGRTPVRRRHELLDEIHYVRYADVPRGGGAKDGEDLVLRNADLQRRTKFLRRQVARVEVFLHELFVEFGNHLDQLRPFRRDPVSHIGGNILLAVISGLVVLVPVHLAVDQVDDAREVFLLPQREEHGNRKASEALVDAGEGSIERGVFPVHLVDYDYPGHLELFCVLPGLSRHDFNARHRAYECQGGVRDAHRPSRVGDEVPVPGRVEHVDFRLVPLYERKARRDGKFLFDLIGLIVRRCRTLFHLAETVDALCGVKHGRRKTRLACSTMADQSDVADILRPINLHSPSLASFSIRIPGKMQNVFYRVTNRASRKATAPDDPL